MIWLTSTTAIVMPAAAILMDHLSAHAYPFTQEMESPVQVFFANSQVTNLQGVRLMTSFVEVMPNAV